MFDSLSTPSLAKAQATQAEKVWIPVFRRGAGSAACKRAMDVVLAGGALLVLLPALLMIALAVVVESRGPVLFRQRRTGRDGKVFTILKFRSMTVTEDGDKIAHASKNDKRVTRVGAFIRATSLDELPQLINVVMGDMSLVGPRPHALAHDNHYGALLPRYADRFAVRPGLTGLAQILGLRGEIHQLSCMARRVDADVEYAAGWTFRDDVLIICRTVPMILKRVNAY
ncbi:sugar transferase [Brevundimonas sp.]|jgi:putative colanic acid biosynthesis UDP-glucose lipid carrier transferase|uniref:sugar transferase n=1 Tax=Brevundimonas sp. TaxID=1871086 RepID=UPI0037BE8272